MTKFIKFASQVRINALLCSSAAVLLAACGGGTADIASEATRTASQSFDSASQAAAASTESATTPAVAAEAGADARNFDVTGYEGGLSAAAESASPDASAAAPTRLLSTVVAVPAAAGAQDRVAQLYRTLLGREPDAAGLAYWTRAHEAGMPIEQVAANLKSSREYQARQQQQTQPTGIPATTNNFYVSPTGSDTAAGTKAAPFKTIARAAQAATKASTTVWVAPGTYAGGFKTTASGTASGRIYYVSTTKWGAKIVPPSSSSNSTAFDNRGNYVSIIGFDIDGAKAGSGTKWLHGIYTGGSYDVIQGNRVHHIANNAACTSAGGSAIGVDSYYKGIKSDIIGNTVHDIGPANCKYIQGIYMSTSGAIKNNVVYRVGEAAIHLWHDANNVIISNNTVTSSNYGIIVGGGDFYNTSAGAVNVHVYNNIVFDNKYGISEQGKTGANNTYRNNLVYQNSGSNVSLKNGLQHSGAVASNPLFTSYSRTSTTPNFKPTISSPVVGRGTATHAHPTDIDGRPRNATTGFDIGAYQH